MPGRPYAHDYVLFLESPLEGQVLRKFATEEAKEESSAGDYENVAPENIVEGDLEQADLITSECIESETPVMKNILDLFKTKVAVVKDKNAHPHKPVLDIDFPAKLIPSSTEGHFHLYLDKKVTWKEYKKLLSVLAEVGIIEQGFADASIHRGYSAVRLPWVPKEKK